MSAPPKQKFLHGLNSELKFGKYLGSTVAEVMLQDPNYIHWCIENIDWFDLTDEAFALLPDQTDDNYWPDDFD